MIRLWPREPLGIASRIALTVVVALLLAQAVSALVYVTDRGEGGPPPHGPGVLSRRVAAIVRLVETTPPSERGRVVEAVDAPGLSVSWSERPPRGLDAGPGFPGDFVRGRIRRALGDGDRPVLVGFERSILLPPGPLSAGSPREPAGTLHLAVALNDGSWVGFTADPERDGPFRLIRFALWMGLVALVIVGLSWWAARRVTAPVAAFARAAERLGVDGEAPLLPETGPRELRIATRAFNRMQERLRRFVEDRTQMLAAISHDLRTPLTRMRLRAEFVDDPEQQRRMLEDLDQMEAMIASTLAFARDDARKEQRALLDVGAMLATLADDLADAGLQVVYEGPNHRTLACRPVALRRAVSNLVDNALKYGGTARIHLDEQPGQVAVVVEDSGPGIPEAELEKVFQPFYRIERSRSRDTGGTGLGLSVARTVARAHGGDVILENRPEGGLRARLLLPDTIE
ncbi:ATP-binding protein [Arenibaculum pallidiluteum]|uniref:ATP-binding protein n=1 Tax=Arenibaculum pallidiluteum TaxID=2812559 RepID=UPI001A972B84|nr:ATP-binding protein [Arenibaculum pallidiluteum]